MQKLFSLRGQDCSQDGNGVPQDNKVVLTPLLVTLVVDLIRGQYGVKKFFVKKQEMPQFL
jgi:hypothetical protein